MRRAALALALIPALAWGLDTDARYARQSLGYVPAAIAKQLVGAKEAAWRQRVAQDVSVWLGAKTYSVRLLAWSRFRPGFNCLAERVGRPAAEQWLSTVMKAQLREQADLDRWNQATQETEKWPEGPAEDCKAPPKLLHS